MAFSVGIDLGTTNSVVSFLDGARLEVAPNSEGGRTTPSVVLYKDNAEVIVGEHAKRQMITLPGRVVRSVKRLMGKRFEDLSQDEIDALPYAVAPLEDGMAGVQLDGGFVLRPEEVSADILDSLRRMAEDYLGGDVEAAVITVPAHFNDQQRTATKIAAEQAGLEVQRIVNEPTAAALAYGMGVAGSDGNVAVFDFGGGTFDISILSLHGDIFEVLATHGDNHLGGDDVDNILHNEFCRLIHEQTGVDPRKDLQAAQRIREAAEKAKCELSNLAATTVSLPFIVADASGPKHFELELARDRFNLLCEPVFKRLVEPCAQCLADAGLSREEISEVLLVGGSTRIPRVQEIVEEFFGKPPNRSLNPDEVVAMGAAVQSGVISGALREVLLLDVTPLTLGIELAGGIFKPLISRNSTVPCEASHKFTTVVDNQTSVVVHVLQGERKVARENHSLAKFRLTGIPPAPKELPEIEVRFSIDANGILSVSAMDLGSGEQTGVIVENYGEIGSQRDHIERMIAAAQENLDADEEFVRFGERRAEADILRSRVDALLAAGWDSIADEDQEALKREIFRLDLAVEARDRTKLDQHRAAVEAILDRYEGEFEISQALEAAMKERFEASPRSAPQAEESFSAIEEDGTLLAGPVSEAPSAAPVAVPAASSPPPRGAAPAEQDSDLDQPLEPGLRAPAVRPGVQDYNDQDEDFDIDLASGPPPPGR